MGDFLFLYDPTNLSNAKQAHWCIVKVDTECKFEVFQVGERFNKTTPWTPLAQWGVGVSWKVVEAPSRFHRELWGIREVYPKFLNVDQCEKSPQCKAVERFLGNSLDDRQRS